MRWLATMSWISFSSMVLASAQHVHVRAVRVGEGEGRVVAVKDGHRPAGPDQAPGLAQHLRRIVDVAEERVQGDDVEPRIAIGQVVGVADLVGDVAGQPLLGGEPAGGVDQGRAVVDADDGRVRPGQAPEGAHLDAGAAA